MLINERWKLGCMLFATHTTRQPCWVNDRTVSPTYCNWCYTVTSFCSRLPRRAPQVLLGLDRRGAAWMPRVGRRAGRPLYRPPDKTEERRSSCNRAAFSLDTFFGYFLWRHSQAEHGNEKSISPSGANTRLTHRCDCVTSAIHSPESGEKCCNCAHKIICIFNQLKWAPWELMNILS